MVHRKKRGKLMGEALDFGTIGEETAVVAGGLDLEAVRPRFEDYKTEAVRIAADAKALTVQDDAGLKEVVELGGRAKRIAANIEVRRKAIIADKQEFIDGVNGLCRSITETLVILKNTKKEIVNPQCAENILKGKYSQYQSRVEMERLERERKAREEAAALQRKLDEEAAAANRKAAEEARKRAEELQRIKREKEEAEARERGAKKAELDRLAKKAEEERLEAIRKAEEEAKKNEVIAPTVIDPVVQAAANVTRSETGSAAFSKAPWTFKVIDPQAVPRAYLIVSDNLLRDAIKQGVRSIPGVKIYQENQVNFRK
jgi:phage-related minor tail protein